MCLDVNPTKPYLTACGLYDGSVVIYNMNENRETYLFRSLPKNSHTEPVWSVKWLDNDVEDRLCFCSISPDGKVTLWTLNKNELVPSTLLELRENDRALSGICFAFHPTDSSLYLCGTEEGTLFKCKLIIFKYLLMIFRLNKIRFPVLGWVQSSRWCYNGCEVESFPSRCLRNFWTGRSFLWSTAN